MYKCWSRNMNCPPIDMTIFFGDQIFLYYYTDVGFLKKRTWSPDHITDYASRNVITSDICLVCMEYYVTLSGILDFCRRVRDVYGSI